MTNKYREAMDKIVVSDRLKEKIIRQAAANHLPDSEEPSQPALFSRFPQRKMHRGTGYAACLLLCGIAVTAGVGLHFNAPAPQSDLPISNPTLSADISDLQPAADTFHVASSLPTDKQTAAKVTNNNDVIPNQSAPITEQTPQEAAIQPLAGHQPYTVAANSGDNSQNPRNGKSMDMTSIREQLGYDFKAPKYIPKSYSLTSTDLLFGSLVEITYQSPQDTILYRTEKTTDDISGDYTEYAVTAKEQINGCTATLKGNGSTFHSVTWNDADTAYSLSSDSGLIKDTFVSIIESVDYEN